MMGSSAICNPIAIVADHQVRLRFRQQRSQVFRNRFDETSLAQRSDSIRLELNTGSQAQDRMPVQSQSGLCRIVVRYAGGIFPAAPRSLLDRSFESSESVNRKINAVPQNDSVPPSQIGTLAQHGWQVQARTVKSCLCAIQIGSRQKLLLCPVFWAQTGEVLFDPLPDH
jgi:hypothetical protein